MNSKKLPTTPGSVVQSDSLLMLTRFNNWVSDGFFIVDTGDLADEDFTILFDAATPEPREVTTVEELDALPFGSIVKGLNGVARKNHDGWTLDGYIYLRQSDDLEEYLIGPFTVLFTPSTDEKP